MVIIQKQYNDGCIIMNKIVVNDLELHEHFTDSGITVFFCANDGKYYYGYNKISGWCVKGVYEDSSEAWEAGCRNLLGVL